MWIHEEHIHKFMASVECKIDSHSRVERIHIFVLVFLAVRGARVILLRPRHLVSLEHVSLLFRGGELEIRASNKDSWSLHNHRPLLGPSPGWKRLLALLHLRQYAQQAPKHGK